jgi:hypothetical protein
MMAENKVLDIARAQVDHNEENNLMRSFTICILRHLAIWVSNESRWGRRNHGGGMRNVYTIVVIEHQPSRAAEKGKNELKDETTTNLRGIGVM